MYHNLHAIEFTCFLRNVYFLTLLLAVLTIQNEIISDEINENIQLNDSLKINEEVVPQSPTTEILDSFSSNKSDFYAWVKFDLKDNESLLKKLLRNKFDNDYYKKKEDKMKQNELIGRFTADLIIKVANKTNLNKKLLTLIPSETKQFSTNENSTDEIVIDNYQMSSTEEKISSPLVTSTSSVMISENPISTSKIINEEIITQKTQENENVTTTQVTTIVSSVNPQFVECVNACGIDHDCVRTKCVIDSTYFGK